MDAEVARYLVDEDLSPKPISLLNRLGYDVARVVTGTQDPDIIQSLGDRHGSRGVWITADRAAMTDHRLRIISSGHLSCIDGFSQCTPRHAMFHDIQLHFSTRWPDGKCCRTFIFQTECAYFTPRPRRQNSEVRPLTSRRSNGIAWIDVDATLECQPCQKLIDPNSCRRSSVQQSSNSTHRLLFNAQCSPTASGY